MGRYLSVTPAHQLQRELDVSPLILLLLMSQCTRKEEQVGFELAFKNLKLRSNFKMWLCIMSLFPLLDIKIHYSTTK